MGYYEWWINVQTMFTNTYMFAKKLEKWNKKYYWTFHSKYKVLINLAERILSPTFTKIWKIHQYLCITNKLGSAVITYKKLLNFRSDNKLKLWQNRFVFLFLFLWLRSAKDVALFSQVQLSVKCWFTLSFAWWTNGP